MRIEFRFFVWQENELLFSTEWLDMHAAMRVKHHFCHFPSSYKIQAQRREVSQEMVEVL